MSIDLTGRVGVVTGAGTGLGADIARTLAAAGADLLLHYRSHADSAASVAEACRALGRRIVLLQSDFGADPGGAADVVEAAVRELGRIDLLVNNAAVTSGGQSFQTLDRQLLAATLAVNLVAPFLATQAAARHMIRAGNGGRVINIGSVHARMAAPGMAAYEASKGAIVAMTVSAAVALGPYGITVNCVAPGAVVVERYAETMWDPDWFVSRTPIGRNGRPEDVSAVVAFLASDGAGFVTGETIYVDGGLTRRLPLVR